ncbi:helix-turn-helix transcriptional regulator [Pedosphaera parvula]|uniref:Transcriptional regulator, AraC family n=1 Tax=Pedosphaera parvula (strain Ellin514) TaxID=320771 RepID=B9XB63_PEDPL|nr:helix-turn-helix domain-containing protein [Pedosphaera parvula]EEF62748.1 transcriptional regulator, AraC family [Pedosphaera parvula Ellin514]
MKLYQPLVLQKLHIRVPGFHIRQFALHKHLPETTDVQCHKHRFSQFLLYLSGQGTQQIKRQSSKIVAGNLVFLPPNVEHAFHRESDRRPICLALDFDWEGAAARNCSVVLLPSATLREGRQIISMISHLQREQAKERSLQLSVEILKLMNLLLEASGFGIPARAISSPITRKVNTLLNTPDYANVTLNSLARRAGYQHDYLNRLLKRQSGLTLGQLRSKNLLQRAQKLLQQPGSVSDVSEALGFSDPNYFSRWFRKQTNLTPRTWRKATTAN